MKVPRRNGEDAGEILSSEREGEEERKRENEEIIEEKRREMVTRHGERQREREYNEKETKEEIDKMNF